MNSIIAAGWMEWVFPIIVFFLYTIGQLITSKGGKPAKPQQPAPKPRDPMAPAEKPRTLEEKLRSEVEEFLRQVQGGKPQTKQPPVVTQRPVVVKVEQTPPKKKERIPPRESVQEHVSKHLSTVDITQHASALGIEVSQADEKLEAHLQQKFQHQVGALEPRQERPQPKIRRNKAAAEIADLLRSPTGMRQIIIASEILRRPEI